VTTSGSGPREGPDPFHHASFNAPT
jgi:hypothetical protein